jgi:hypothetical protein
MMATEIAAAFEAPPGFGLGPNAAAEAGLTLQQVRQYIEDEFIEGVDFGEIPGTGGGKDKPKKKPLLQPGAHKLFRLFHCWAMHTIDFIELGNGHLEVRSKTSLIQFGTGSPCGEGLGSCSTMEKKYRYRNGERQCPSCGKANIIKGKPEFSKGQQGYAQGGWLCFKKLGGCGESFPDADTRIVGQTIGQVENPDLADQRFTVEAMAVKRGDVAAARTMACVSDMFGTEDDPPQRPEPQQQAPQRESSRPPAAPEPATPSSGAGIQFRDDLNALDRRDYPGIVTHMRGFIKSKGWANVTKFGDLDSGQVAYCRKEADRWKQEHPPYDEPDAVPVDEAPATAPNPSPAVPPRPPGGGKRLFDFARGLDPDGAQGMMGWLNAYGAKQNPRWGARVVDWTAEQADVALAALRTAYGIPDEAIPQPVAPPKPYPQNNSGHGRGQYATPQQIAAYRDWAIGFTEDCNQRWYDDCQDENGNILPDTKAVLHEHQLTFHLLKWAIAGKMLAELDLTLDAESGKPVPKCSIEQAKAYVAIAYHRSPGVVLAEAQGYFGMQVEIELKRQREEVGSR